MLYCRYMGTALAVYLQEIERQRSLCYRRWECGYQKVPFEIFLLDERQCWEFNRMYYLADKLATKMRTQAIEEITGLSILTPE